MDKQDEHVDGHPDCMASMCFSMEPMISSAQPSVSGRLDAPWTTYYTEKVSYS